MIDDQCSDIVNQTNPKAKHKCVEPEVAILRGFSPFELVPLKEDQVGQATEVDESY